ncbi:hypothetical protein OG552_32905 [Streptomyces sp. NBC_01476]|uniref:hypothetical protein n=1 Tax=Streptomyces sp. NBC_01476 TaxID=2903881 RepID=UPI002E303306|nr:hypothetical protein [Streptomyces sp. NBC_01476]
MNEFCATAVPKPSSESAGYWLGGWIFIPASLGSAAAPHHAYLERDGERIPVPHCSLDLAQFAEAMKRIETKFSQHYGERGTPV